MTHTRARGHAVAQRFRLPGASPPASEPIAADVLAWADRVRAAIDPAAIAATVAALPGPRSRSYDPEAMDAAEAYVVDRLQRAGWTAARWPFRLTQVDGYADEVSSKRRTVFPVLEGANIVATLEGAADRAAFVVVAHLDTVRETPGANDNTASVAGVLALADAIRGYRFRRTVVLAFPDMEELGVIGAIPLVRELTRQRPIIGAVNLENLAYVCEEPDSQRLPAGLSWLYPVQSAAIRANRNRGDFAAIVYNGAAEAIAATLQTGIERYAGAGKAIAVRAPGQLPVVGAVLSALVPGVRNFGRSDHLRFWEAGLPAAMITDTADFRCPQYHSPDDTADKLDFARVADAVAATAMAIACYAQLIAGAEGDS